MSKILYRSAGIPVLASMVAAIFFSASPGFLFAAADSVATAVDPNDPNGEVSFQLGGNGNNSMITITIGGDSETFKRFGASGNGLFLTQEIDDLIERCFPAGGGSGVDPLTPAEIQLISDFLQANLP